MSPKHFGNGPPHSEAVIHDTAGNRVGAMGRQTDGTYSHTTFAADGTTPLVIVGELPDGNHGILVMNENGRTLFRVTSEEGQVAPYAALPSQTSAYAYLSGSSTTTFRPGTKDPTLTELWRSDFYSVGPDVDYDLMIYANGGTCTWQIKCYEYGGGSPIAVAAGTETSNVQRAGTFSLSSASLIGGSGDVAGRYMTLRLEASITGATTGDITLNGPFVNHN